MFTVSYVTIELPADAKRHGARLRWWQPQHGGAGRADWALDSVVIGGKTTNDLMMKDSFDSGHSDVHWIQRDNTHLGSYCGSNTALKGEAVSKENVTLTTADMRIEEGFLLQFSISVGCNASWDMEISPVHLQFSTDYGMSWSHVVSCDPTRAHAHCGEHVVPPSVYFANGGWQRETLLLVGPVVSK